MNSEILKKLLSQTWQSPVFGDSFKSSDTVAVVNQINQIATQVSDKLFKFITEGMPELSEKEVQEIVEQIVPKSVIFCPALTAGEVADTSKLSAVATAIGLMYWGDQTTDRGDAAMPIAIKKLASIDVTVPVGLQKQVNARLRSLRQIEQQIRLFAKPEDVEIVVDCFVGQVLLNEVRLQELSQDFIKSSGKVDFINNNAKEIAKLMVVDAGLPSVSSSLYAIYRWQDQSLPPLSELYNDPQIILFLQKCNAVVRFVDEIGDWKMDSGDNPEWGIFVINLFNQATPGLAREFLSLAGMSDGEFAEQVVSFHNNPDQQPAITSDLVIQIFNHIKNVVENLPAETVQKHSLYILLCKRVLEIGKVNEVGDVNLAG